MNLNLTHIISFCKGVFHGNSTEFTVSHISIDSRSLQNGSDTLFFAIKGQNHDAHMYLEELIAIGYPQEKMKWYRGGMQSWLRVGLS